MPFVLCSGLSWNNRLRKQSSIKTSLSERDCFRPAHRTTRNACSRISPSFPKLFFRDQAEQEFEAGAETASYSQCTGEEDGASSVPRRNSSCSGQTYTVTLSTAAPSTSPSNSTAYRADSLLHNKIDERQRLARERREEREKQNALREAQWQERDERAKQHYEKHLEERRRRLEEQRSREEKRRIAVEEKRRQKFEEDKARHEAVIRRTTERSQRTRPKPNRWSWGGALPPHTPSTPADSDRRAVSTMNLSKHMDPVITKRLSSSSATLLHSPDRALRMRTASSPVISRSQSKPRLHQGKTAHDINTGLRRLPLSPWENTIVNRLQQPTHSYLARSRSAASLSKELTVSCHPMGPISFKSLQAKPLPHCRSHDRNLSRGVAPSQPSCRRTTGSIQQHKEHDFTRKSWGNLSLPLAPTLSLPPRKRSSSPGKQQSKGTSPSPGRPPQKPVGRPPTPKLIKSPVADDPGNLRPVKLTPEVALTPPSPGGGRGGDVEHQVLSPTQPRPQPAAVNSPPANKTSAGTTDREEASRILAENRRQAREQREREEEQRQQQEEQQRLAKEEMARRKAEERAKREEEAQRQAEERRLKEEEEERKGEEERLQKEREEAERLQKQREDEESRQKEEVERLRQERDKHFQKEEAERLERKKRLEEIMKRTRRSDPSEKKVTPQRNGGNTGNRLHLSRRSRSTKSPVSPGPSAGAAPAAQHQNGNGHAAPNSTPAPLPDTSITTLTPPDGRENGEFEEVITLPPDSRQRPPGEEQQQREERGRVIAFKENGLLKPLGGMDDLSAQQETVTPQQLHFNIGPVESQHRIAFEWSSKKL
ncbi:unnamed protein product [Merluccius merluccius]